MLPKRLKWLKWLLVIPLIVLALFLVMGIKYSGLPSERELGEKFITTNPIDLSQIRALSKYRSCAGHDYRGPLVSTGKKEATPRSMKHYIKVNEALAGKNGVIKAIAPFDAVISNIEKRDPERTPENQQIWLTPDTSSKVPRQWHFVFFHIDLKDGLDVGSKVKAGDVVGYAYMTRGPENTTDNFDMALKFTRPMAAPAIDLPLSHASDEVLAEYEKYGVTLENLVIAEDFRDENACPTTGEGLVGDVYFLPTSDPNDYLYLTK